MKTYLPDLKTSALLFGSYFVAIFVVNFLLQLILNGLQSLLDAGVINPERYSPEMFFGTGFMVVVALFSTLGLVTAFWIVKHFSKSSVSARALNISTVAFSVVVVAILIWQDGYIELSDTLISVVMPIAIFYFIARRYNSKKQK